MILSPHSPLCLTSFLLPTSLLSFLQCFLANYTKESPHESLFPKCFPFPVYPMSSLWEVFSSSHAERQGWFHGHVTCVFSQGSDSEELQACLNALLSVLKFLIIFEQGDPRFCFALGSENYVVGLLKDPCFLTLLNLSPLPRH